MAADALETILFDEKKLPKMTDPAEIKIEDPGAFVALVSTDLTKSAANFEKTVRKNVTVPAKLALQAEKKKINFYIKQTSIKKETNNMTLQETLKINQQIMIKQKMLIKKINYLIMLIQIIIIQNMMVFIWKFR